MFILFDIIRLNKNISFFYYKVNVPSIYRVELVPSKKLYLIFHIKIKLKI